MRKLLLASAAMLSASAGLAYAQNTTSPQGVERAAPPLLPHAGGGAITSAPVSAVGANNNNNVTARALPGGTMNPTPGTFVVRLGGRVTVVGGAGWSSADTFTNFTPAAGSSARITSLADGNAAANHSLALAYNSAWLAPSTGTTAE